MATITFTFTFTFTFTEIQSLAPGAWSAAAKLGELSAVSATVKVTGVLNGEMDCSWAPT